MSLVSSELAKPMPDDMLRRYNGTRCVMQSAWFFFSSNTCLKLKESSGSLRRRRRRRDVRDTLKTTSERGRDDLYSKLIDIGDGVYIRK